MPKIPNSREERRGTGRRERAPGEGDGLFCSLAGAGREREREVRGVFMVPTQGSKIPLDLN